MFFVGKVRIFICFEKKNQKVKKYITNLKQLLTCEGVYIKWLIESEIFFILFDEDIRQRKYLLNKEK